MKNNKKMVFIVIVNIIIIGLICSFININKNVTKEKQIIKEMSESTQVSNLQIQINTLNKEHTDYANYIQTCKNRIATALTNEKVATSGNDTLETMSTNIGKVLQARTADATATESDIAEGKTAYVNGKLVNGTNLNSSPKFFNNGAVYTANGVAINTINLSSYSGFRNLELNKNLFIVPEGNISMHCAYDRTGLTGSLYTSYNPNTGNLQYYTSITGPGVINSNYYVSISFKILIVD